MTKNLKKKIFSKFSRKKGEVRIKEAPKLHVLSLVIQSCDPDLKREPAEISLGLIYSQILLIHCRFIADSLKRQPEE